MRNPKRVHIYIMLLCFVAAMVAGCGSPRVSQLTNQLHGCTNGIAQRTKSYLQKLNEIHRVLFVDGEKIGDVAVQDSKELPNKSSLSQDDMNALVQLINSSAAALPTSGQMPYYSSEAIQARTCYASAIETYSTQLNLIVNSKTSAEANDRLKELQAQLQNLGVELAQTKIQNAEQVGTKLSALSGPIVNLGTIGANALLTYFRTTWANDAIQRNQEIYSRICIALSDDIQLGAERTKTRTTRLLTLYKRHFAKKRMGNTFSTADQQVYEAELDKLTRFLQEIDNESPAYSFVQAKNIHDKLAALVKKKS